MDDKDRKEIDSLLESVSGNNSLINLQVRDLIIICYQSLMVKENLKPDEMEKLELTFKAFLKEKLLIELFHIDCGVNIKDTSTLIFALTSFCLHAMGIDLTADQKGENDNRIRKELLDILITNKDNSTIDSEFIEHFMRIVEKDDNESNTMLISSTMYNMIKSHRFTIEDLDNINHAVLKLIKNGEIKNSIQAETGMQLSEEEVTSIVMVSLMIRKLRN